MFDDILGPRKPKKLIEKPKIIHESDEPAKEVVEEVKKNGPDDPWANAGSGSASSGSTTEATEEAECDGNCDDCEPEEEKW